MRSQHLSIPAIYPQTALLGGGLLVIGRTNLLKRHGRHCQPAAGRQSWEPARRLTSTESASLRRNAPIEHAPSRVSFRRNPVISDISSDLKRVIHSANRLTGFTIGVEENELKYGLVCFKQIEDGRAIRDLSTNWWCSKSSFFKAVSCISPQKNTRIIVTDPRGASTKREARDACESDPSLQLEPTSSSDRPFAASQASGSFGRRRHN